MEPAAPRAAGRSQRFDAEPTAAELVGFLDPDGRAAYVRLEDSARLLAARPGTIPLGFTAACLAVPAGIVVWYMVRKASTEGLGAFDVIGIVITCLAVPSMLGIVMGLNAMFRARGDYFVLDKTLRELRLPRSDVTLTADQVCGFVLFCGEYSESRPCELSVLSADGAGVARHAVVIGEHAGRVRQIGRQLADFFAVPLREVDASAAAAAGRRV